MTVTSTTLSNYDWDSLAQRVVNDQDRVLFQEAVRAACASALRAAYITLWLACAESLKRKFKEASQFDDTATKIVAEISDKESKQQAVDAYILTKAKEYGFVSEAEFNQLESIYKQRCIYGHPYEQAPLAEQIIAAARTVVEFVLNQPTKLRHGYLSRQVDLICGDKTFLDDHPAAIDGYVHIVYTRSTADIHLWFLQKLWKQAAAFMDDPSMGLYVRRVVWFSWAFLKRCDDAFFMAWDVVQDLTQYPFVSHVLATPDLFPKISDHAQDIVVGNLLETAKSQASILTTIEALLTSNLLTSRQKERFSATIADIPLPVIASSGIRPTLYVRRIIEALKTHNWYEQNPAIDVIREIGPSGIKSLSADQQRELGNNVLQAAEGNANNAISFLTEIGRVDAKWPEAFVEGIVSETLVNEDNKLRFKTKQALKAFLCLRAVPKKKRKDIISRLADRLRSSTPKYQWSMNYEREEFVGIIDRAIENAPKELAALATLKNVVTNLEIPEDD